MNRAGLTLVEVLLSLALLASLSAVGVDWAVTSARLSADAGAAARWNAAARATLHRIADDLTQGDFVVLGEGKPRVRVDHQRLTIATRDGGTTHSEYRLADRSLHRSTDGAGPRLLLGGVSAFECGTTAIEEPDHDDPAKFVLTVTLCRDAAHAITRSYLIPREWLP